MTQHPNNPHIVVLTREGAATNTVAAYSGVGCYPIFYFTSESALCAHCVQKDLDDLVDHVRGHEVNWEDPAMYCGSCGKRIESAYAEEEE